MDAHPLPLPPPKIPHARTVRTLTGGMAVWMHTLPPFLPLRYLMHAQCVHVLLQEG